MKNKIIFLNGCSSAGKTSLVKAIQHLSEDFWLTFGIDSALEAVPDKYVGSGKKASQGFNFLSSVDKEGFPVTEVKTGSYGEKVSNSVPKMIKQLVDNGLNVIVDEVIWDKKDLENYASLLKNHQVYYVKVNCDLLMMEEREILRGDRQLGLARFQFSKMKDLDKKWKYDLEVNTSLISPFANAEKILQFLKEN